MSKVAITGNPSGTGTLTIAAPNTNSDFTLSLPATTAPILAGSGITLSASAPANTLVTTAAGNVGIGTSSPGFSGVAGRTYLTLVGSGAAANGIGVLQLVNNNAASNNNGNIEWVDIGNTSSSSLRSAFISSGSTGSTANNLGAYMDFATKSDGVSGSGAPRMRIAADGSQSSVIPGGSTLYPEFKCRAWVNFNGTGTVAIRASGNVSSITDNGTGNYTVNFTTAMPDADYGIGHAVTNTEGSWVNRHLQFFDRGTTSVRVEARNATPTLGDPVFCGVSIFR